MIFRPHRFLTKRDEYGDNDVSLLSLPKKRRVQNHLDSMIKTIVFRIYCCYKTTYKYTCVKWVTTLFWSPKFRYSSGEMIIAFIWIWYPLITSMGASGFISNFTSTDSLPLRTPAFGWQVIGGDGRDIIYQILQERKRDFTKWVISMISQIIKGITINATWTSVLFVSVIAATRLSFSNRTSVPLISIKTLPLPAEVKILLFHTFIWCQLLFKNSHGNSLLSQLTSPSSSLSSSPKTPKCRKGLRLFISYFVANWQLI